MFEVATTPTAYLPAGRPPIRYSPRSSVSPLPTVKAVLQPSARPTTAVATVASGECRPVIGRHVARRGRGRLGDERHGAEKDKDRGRSAFHRIVGWNIADCPMDTIPSPHQMKGLD